MDKNTSYVYILPIILNSIGLSEEDEKEFLLAIKNTYSFISNSQKFVIEVCNEKINDKYFDIIKNNINFESLIKNDNETLLIFSTDKSIKDTYYNFVRSKYSKIPSDSKKIIAKSLQKIAYKYKIVHPDIYLTSCQILWKDPELKKKLLKAFSIKELEDDIELAGKIKVDLENYNKSTGDGGEKDTKV